MEKWEDNLRWLESQELERDLDLVLKIRNSNHSNNVNLRQEIHKRLVDIDKSRSESSSTSESEPERIENDEKKKREMIQKITNELSSDISSRTEYKFEDGDRIGDGSFGTVYKAMILNSKQMAHQMAVKRIDLVNEKSWFQLCQMVKREIKILRDLDHQNIVKYLDSYAENGTVYILMDLCDSSLKDTLKKYIRPSKKVSVQDKEKMIKNFTHQICLAIDYIHSKKIVHTDIKCDNIGLDKNGSIRLFDFGVARMLDEQNTSFIDEKRTSFWLPPEMLSDHKFGLNVDCWSLGATVYEMDTGKPPFLAQGMSSVMVKAHAIAGTLSPPSLSKEYSRDAVDFVRVCMTVDPNKRPSASELLYHKFFASINKPLA